LPRDEECFDIAPFHCPVEVDIRGPKPKLKDEEEQLDVAALDAAIHVEVREAVTGEELTIVKSAVVVVVEIAADVLGDLFIIPLQVSVAIGKHIKGKLEILHRSDSVVEELITQQRG